MKNQKPDTPLSAMASLDLHRRTVLYGAAVAGTAAAVGPALLSAPTAAAVVPPARGEVGAAASEFAMDQVRLTASRWMDNQNRTLSYLRFADTDRLLYSFRANHGLSTGGAAALGGWEAPNFPFRTHSQGHFLTAWAQAWAVLGDTVCRDKAAYMVAELAKCQANNAARGFAAGYLSGFPESEISVAETGNGNGNVPYYALHKTLAGLLDVWRYMENTQARDVLLHMAAWVDTRTARLTTQQMQTTLRVEFGGMNAVLADLHFMTNDARWLTVAQRFDHASVFDPLANNSDQLAGLHANTQVPKWIGAAREYKATGTTRYRDIARNAWTFTVGAHTYAIGGNSQDERFRTPNAISTHLTNDTCEQCNTYNMLKLTRELWSLDPENAGYFDFYERALLNHLIGAQDPADEHGHITYFTPLEPGGRRGVGPKWGGGTWSTDYASFWCCQGTGLETNTKLMDSIYFHSGTTLTVNLFMPSVLTWTERGITVTQTTSYPVSDTTTLTVTGSVAGSWTMRVRIPAWATGATIAVNGVAQSVATTPGTYATLTRSWSSGDTVTVRLPMTVRVEPSNDNPDVAAITYGPVVLAGNYGNTALSSLPALTATSVSRTSSSSLAFTATANGATVDLAPFYDAHGFNYTVYWSVGSGGGAGTSAPFRLSNVASGLVLGITNASTADGALALQWDDNGTTDHDWVPVVSGTAVKLRCVNGGKVLGVEDMSTADGARVLQWGDTGTADHLWTILDDGDGTHRVRNNHTGKLLGTENGSTARGAQIVMDPDNGSADNRWRFVPTGTRRIQNVNSGQVLGVTNMSTADGALVIQWGDNGTADHLWTAEVGANGHFRLRNQHTGKVLAVESGGTGNGTRAVQMTDTGATSQQWRLRHTSGDTFRIQAAGGRVLGVQDMSTAQGAQVLIWDDNGTNDHLWRFV